MPTQIPMPKIIYGTAWKKDRTADLVVKAITLGFRGIDTACQPKHYHEAGVGQALARLREQGIPRENLFLQTKFTPVDGQDPAQIPYDPKASLAAQVAQSFAVSQKNLGTDYLDSLVLHSPLVDHDQLMIVWKALETIHKDGGTRQLGISNCYDLPTLSRLYQEATIKPTVLQNRFYGATGFDRGLRAFCREKSISYQSFWSLTANPEILDHRLVGDMAREFSKTPAQIFFRFLTQQGITPLTGTCREGHMKDDLEVFDFQLSEKKLQAIDNLLI